ncbi:MAG: hypothetical protein HQM10_11905 [Candidatus Riflebacteria bacterium]|nr:hypothetical protein [Candidatus Riflebacteria bacterium]
MDLKIENSACEKYQLQFSSWLDGEAEEPCRHSESCPECEKFVEIAKKSRSFLRDESLKKLPESLNLNTLKKIGISRKTDGKNSYEDTVSFLGALRLLFSKPVVAVAFSIVVLVVVLKMVPDAQQKLDFRVLSAKNLIIGKSGSEIILSSGADGVIEIEKGCSLKIWGGPAEIKYIEGKKDFVSLEFISGTACFEWNHLKHGKLLVGIGSITMSVVGTTWKIVSSGDGTFSVELAEGAVVLQDSNSKKVELKALNRISFRKDLEKSVTTAFNPYTDKLFSSVFGNVIIGER